MKTNGMRAIRESEMNGCPHCGERKWAEYEMTANGGTTRCMVCHTDVVVKKEYWCGECGNQHVEFMPGLARCRKCRAKYSGPSALCEMLCVVVWYFGEPKKQWTPLDEWIGGM